MTGDTFLGGRVRLRQPESGYRAGMDAAVLAAALRLKPGMTAAEFGCGAGAALLSAAVLYPRAHLIGLEREAAVAALARANVQTNRMHDRVEILEGNALDQTGLRELDAVFFNPPFFDDFTALRAPGSDKTSAWLSDEGLAAWVHTGLQRLRSGGVITVIQRADRLDDLLAVLSPKAGAISILPIQARAADTAKRIVVQAIKSARGPLQIVPALVLHVDSSGAFTPQARAILTGQACLALRV